ncbi:MAG: SMC-Scp complex subunit ScpB [Candidatus Odinarchaeota archaeon]
MEKNLDNDIKKDIDENSGESAKNLYKNVSEKENELHEVKPNAQKNEEYPNDEIVEDEGEMEDEKIQMENINSSNETFSIEHEEIPLEIDLRTFNKNLIEAALFAAGGPLTIEELSTKLEFPKKEVEELVNELAFEYLERVTALIIAQIGDRYQMQIRPEYTEKVSKFAKGGAIAERYLRTLTVIALKQPILKSTLIKIRGTSAYEHVKYLLDNDFINAVKKGRSHELTTTDKYADMFGLPKDIRMMKQVMVSQLGIKEEDVGKTSDEIEEGDYNEAVNENEEGED